MPNKQAYKVNLTAYLAACELNYARLSRLLPDELFQPNKQTDDAALSLNLIGAHGIYAYCQFLSQSASVYTSELLLVIQIEHLRSSELSSYLPEAAEVLSFVLKLSHDAKVVEILKFQGQKVKVKYSYPNLRMHQEDEKLQQHKLLGLCLQSILKDAVFGRSVWQAEQIDD